MSMYTSTRDVTEQKLTYSDVLLQGLAPDRGLYVPTDYPKIDHAALRRLTGVPYIELFTYVKSLFVGDSIDANTQVRLAQAAYGLEKFPHTANGIVTPVHEISSGLYVQQLSLGPTAAFKDMALQPLGQDMQYVLAQRGESLTILGATSGDTGSAAEAAFKGLPGIRLFMLSPEEGMSDFQKAQMGSLTGDNIFNISIPGRFDDCQDLVKAIKQDPAFAHLGAVNSINWGRVASQVPYYIAGYLQIVGEHIGREVDFVVPTGNFGNVLAGYVARAMGVPIRRLIVATNENDVLNTLIQTGEYSRSPKAHVTSSPSMDITVASNYERLAFDIFNRDPVKTAAYMGQFETTGSVRFTEFGLPDDTLLQAGFDSGTSTAIDRIESIRWTYRESGMVIDPHTADGITVARRKNDGTPMVCMSTALPVKFEATIEQALGFIPPREERFVGLGGRATKGFVLIDNDAAKLKTFIAQHSAL